MLHTTQGLLGQTDLCWEAAGDLRDPVSDEDFERGMTWDVRLALALLEATSDPQIGGKFWSIYGRLLPEPHTVTVRLRSFSLVTVTSVDEADPPPPLTVSNSVSSFRRHPPLGPRQVPFCLPERLLVQLHNDGMAERARKQVKRMRSLYPDMMRTLLSHPKTAIYAARPKAEGDGTVGEAKQEAEKETDAAPMALLWAFAMVRSRAFAADGNRFAFVPFLVSVARGGQVGEWVRGLQ